MIRRAARGDPEAVKVLYDRYSPRVYAVVRRIVGDDNSAEDCTQEVWMRVFGALDRFRGEARFSTWVHRIAVNAALQEVRSADARRKREEFVALDRRIEARTGDPLLRHRLERALDRLPLGMRRVIILHDVEGFTHEEIGRKLGVTSGTSKSQLFKARAKMRNMLTQTVSEPEYGVGAWGT
ncbi:MAG: sigma-70 family RNA polymerase sigma factor [Gemmatimonadetes bacterium]|nr:sigma-70 family RNA polymerase sigma factor [Gemmatimonadota bacterium]